MEKYNELKMIISKKMQEKFPFTLSTNEKLYNIIEDFVYEKYIEREENNKKSNIVSINKNDFDVQLTMEIQNEFVSYIIKQIKKGNNDELKEGLMLDCEYINSFIIKKMQNVISSISKEELDILFEEVINDMINNFTDELNFSSELAKRIKTKYLNYVNGTDEIVKKEKVNNDRSIYSYFNNYSDELIDATFMGANIKIKELFIKKWGRELNGKNAKTIKKFEINEFEESLENFENLLIKALEFQKRGFSLDDISKNLRNNQIASAKKENHDIIVEQKQEIEEEMLEEKNIEKEKLNNIKEDFKISEKDKSIKRTYAKKIMTVDELASMYNVSLEKLEELVAKLPKSMQLVYRRYYGIDTVKMNSEQIMESLKLSKFLFNTYLTSADKLIRQNIIENKEVANNVALSPKVAKPVVKLDKIIDKNVVTFKVSEGKIISDSILVKKEFDEEKLKFINEDKNLTIYEQIIIYLKMRYIDIENSDELISEILDIKVSDLIDCYIKNLSLFKESINLVIADIIKFDKNNYKKIFNCSYFSELFGDLTIKEKIYMFLKMQNKEELLNRKEIKEIIDSNMSLSFDIENMQIKK
ncbi:MAG: hypothetical protein PHN42_00860 [Bacilli bacterium]|nr:hypothetical protein [Bacilli bacterium]